MNISNRDEIEYPLARIAGELLAFSGKGQESSA
jgi:hypothetical protein